MPTLTITKREPKSRMERHREERRSYKSCKAFSLLMFHLHRQFVKDYPKGKPVLLVGTADHKRNRWMFYSTTLNWLRVGKDEVTGLPCIGKGLPFRFIPESTTRIIDATKLPELDIRCLPCDYYSEDQTYPCQWWAPPTSYKHYWCGRFIEQAKSQVGGLVG